MLTFAIGDTHGCSDLLTDLLRRIADRAAGEPHAIVALGDYIDRGPDSAGVIATFRALQAKSASGRVVCLMGNHEDMLLRALRRPDSAEVWLRNGGHEMLASFDVERPEDLPQDVVDWIAGCPTVFEDSLRCYVHAGLNPAFDRVHQRDSDRLWIRHEFLESKHDFGRYIVHGHTPLTSGRPDMRRNRVNLDTGAVYGGKLTAAILTDAQAAPDGFLQVP